MRKSYKIATLQFPTTIVDGEGEIAINDLVTIYPLKPVAADELFRVWWSEAIEDEQLPFAGYQIGSIEPVLGYDVVSVTATNKDRRVHIAMYSDKNEFSRYLDERVVPRLGH